MGPRCAGKGCVGGILSTLWFDNLDHFLNLDSDANLWQIASVASSPWLRSHLAPAAVAASVVLDQFVWSPLLFGTFEIPVSTLLNGGLPASIPREVSSKLGGLLVANAKVWTPANAVVYSAPVEWRLAVSNCVDLV